MDLNNLISTNYKLLSRARTALTLKLLTSVKLSLLVHKDNRPRLAGTWQQNAPYFFAFLLDFPLTNSTTETFDVEFVRLA